MTSSGWRCLAYVPLGTAMGGRVIHRIYGDLWQVEIVYGRRHRNQWGVRTPFRVMTTVYEREGPYA